MTVSVQNTNSAPAKRYIFNPPNNMSKTPIYDNVWRNIDLLNAMPKRKPKTNTWGTGDIIRIIVGIGALAGMFVLLKKSKASAQNFLTQCKNLWMSFKNSIKNFFRPQKVS